MESPEKFFEEKKITYLIIKGLIRTNSCYYIEMPRRIKPQDPFPMDRKVGREEILAVKKVMKNKRLTFLSGGDIEEFEMKFAQYMGSQHAIAVSSGTAALHVVLAAVGIGAGDEVLVPPYTFVATATSVLHQNVIPIFVDIDPTTFCMDPSDLENKLTDRTKAIIPVHLFGHPADLDSILLFAEKHNLFVLEYTETCSVFEEIILNVVT